MRLLFVADGRSPIALNWIRYFVQQGEQVHLASTFPCQVDFALSSYHFLPVAFSNARRSSAGNKGNGKSPLWGAAAVGPRTTIRQWLGPLTLPAAVRDLQDVIERIKPDLVHAMRIPYEGMVAALARPAQPLLISIWGNDFTLHARSTPLMARTTRLALQSASALHADCHRDLRLAAGWGLPAELPAIVLPGAGGVQLDLFHPPGPPDPPVTPAIINPRGFRAYVRNDTFFRALPALFSRYPHLQVFCPNMAGDRRAQKWLEELGIRQGVQLLPALARNQMAELFRRAQVAVSPSLHDGTPNTLLEAMASGCFPVAGDLESLREWIIPGVNGLLVDPGKADDLAQAILLALDQPELRQRAVEYNLPLVSERAEHGQVMRTVAAFYRELIR